MHKDYLEVAGITDVGLVRTLNEDNFHVDKDLDLVMVADGMGGHDSGEVASQMAVEVISDFLMEYDYDALAAEKADTTLDMEPAERGEDETFSEARTVPELHYPQADAIRAAVENANRRIHEINVARGFPDGRGMGTTLVGFWFLNDRKKGIAFHVGDSRLYRYRDGFLTQLTRDHSLYQDWLDRGAEGQPPAHNIIMRALGPWQDVECDLSLQDTKVGDIYLLCSDGLSSMAGDDKIIEVLKGADFNDLEGVGQSLIKLAHSCGGKDNVTVILAKCK